MDASEFACAVSTAGSTCAGLGLGECTGCGDEWCSGFGSGWGSDYYGGGYLDDGSGYGSCRSVGYGYGTGSGPW